MAIRAMGWTSHKQEIRRQRVTSGAGGSEQGHEFLPRQHSKEFVLVLGESEPSPTTEKVSGDPRFMFTSYSEARKCAPLMTLV